MYSTNISHLHTWRKNVTWFGDLYSDKFLSLRIKKKNEKKKKLKKINQSTGYCFRRCQTLQNINGILVSAKHSPYNAQCFAYSEKTKNSTGWKEA